MASDVTADSAVGDGPVLRVGAVQWDVRRGDLEANLVVVREELARAAADGLDLVCLPEMWPTSFEAKGLGFADGPRRREALAAAERARDELASLSARFELAVAGTALAADPGGGPPRNRLELWVAGAAVLQFDKVHLFSPTGETAGFTAGDRPPPVVTWRGVRIGGLVCYDLRFGAVCEALQRAGAELVLVPAQWPTPRAAHWRALVLGRAAELQAYVLGCNRLGTETFGRERRPLAFPGNSLVARPDGLVLAEGRGAPGRVEAELDLDGLRRLREQVPVRRDRRDEVYATWRSECAPEGP